MHTPSKGSKGRAAWYWLSDHWLAVVLTLAVLAILVAVIVSVALGAGGDNDWNARLFTYRHGRLDVAVDNILLLAFGLGLVWKFVRGDDDD